LEALQCGSYCRLVPDLDRSVEFEAAEHVLIEGENLEVLKLLQPAYAGSVGLIYLDPPYNTGNDFVYPDNYSTPLEEYLRLTGRLDTRGKRRTSRGLDPAGRNMERSGAYHSAWLSMLFPRLILARQLLREDGLLCVSIDDHEVHHLRMLLNEVFGEECFLAQVVWQRHGGGGNDSRHFAVDHEYVLVYARDREAAPRLGFRLSPAERAAFSGRDDLYDRLGGFRYRSFRRMRPEDPRPGLQYSIRTPDGSEVTDEWRWEEGRFLRALEEGRIRFRQDLSGRWQIEYKLYERQETGEARARVPRSLLIEGERNSDGKRQLREALGAESSFPNPKPVGLMRHFLQLLPDQDLLVMDFFAGSGSTGQAVLEQNREDGGRRRFLLVQLPVPLEHPEYATLTELCRARLLGAAARLPPGSSGKGEPFCLRYLSMAESQFRRWEPPPPGSPGSVYQAQLALFVDPLREGWTERELLFEIALREGFPLTMRIECRSVGPEISIWQVTDRGSGRRAFACFAEDLRGEVAARLLAATPVGRADRFFCRDSALDDETLTALDLCCRLSTV
ncbi:MAG: site-specific DNA-methyltransferase, partial [SAR202 cluster bacterium]|nr:site-specific DNA-methyltransferase [SAR202 cluster bacterium]